MPPPVLWMTVAPMGLLMVPFRVTSPTPRFWIMTSVGATLRLRANSSVTLVDFRSTSGFSVVLTTSMLLMVSGRADRLVMSTWRNVSLKSQVLPLPLIPIEPVPLALPLTSKNTWAGSSLRMSFTKIAGSVIVPLVWAVLVAVRTLTFTALSILPSARISSSGLWPEKPRTSAFQLMVRVWLLFTDPWSPPAASARLVWLALRSTTMPLFVTSTKRARWSSVSDGEAVASVASFGFSRYGSLAARGPAVTLARSVSVRGSATTREFSVVVLFAVEDNQPNSPATFA